MEIKFKTEGEAQSALEQCGFSIGRLQRGDPRGLLYGDFDIAKWRNLSKKDRDGLHGIYQRENRGGPVVITLSAHCPTEPVLELSKEAAAWR